MGGKFNTSAYAMKATLLQMATIRRLTMSFMPKVANTKAEATNPIALLFVAIAAIPLCAMTALWCVMTVVTIAPPHQWTEMSTVQKWPVALYLAICPGQAGVIEPMCELTEKV